MIASPPSWRMATSKETRVRVDGLSKIIASVWPASGRSPRSPRLRVRLHGAAVVEHAAQIASGGGRSRSRKCRAPCAHPAAALLGARARCVSRGAGARRGAAIASSISASLMISGGSRRTTLSPAGDREQLLARAARRRARRSARRHLQAEHQALAADFGDDAPDGDP